VHVARLLAGVIVFWYGWMTAGRAEQTGCPSRSVWAWSAAVAVVIEDEGPAAAALPQARCERLLRCLLLGGRENGGAVASPRARPDPPRPPAAGLGVRLVTLVRVDN